ncbi:hypothetical protein TIFTF001_004834 [Ficus carica]|uniref:Uncharacterized protein n=1 Tax=Ficus carica TaxID=3494 RepID=A0AA88CWP6_FICCA|nr:hypothetical protein TIFTF001_004834 [Ficus carica]
MGEEIMGPGRSGSEVKGADLESASAEQLQAESGTDEAETAGDYEGVALDAFVFSCVQDFATWLLTCPGFCLGLH